MRRPRDAHRPLELLRLARDLAVEARERRVDGLDAREVVVEEHAVRERQRPGEERDREARLEDDLRRLRIDVEVELGRGRDVADAAAHDPEALHLLRDRRIARDRGGDVRQRRLREDVQLAGRLVDPAHELVDGMLGLRALRRLREERVAHAVLP